MRIAGVFGALMLSACGSDGDTADPAASSPTTTTIAATVEDSAQVSPATDASATTTSPAASEAEPLLEGVALLRVITPTAAVGIRPLLKWEPVDGAATYRAVVLTAAGDIAWVWSGDEAVVPYGGAEFPLDHGDGPIVTPGSTWSVVALDGQREVLAISERRRLEP